MWQSKTMHLPSFTDESVASSHPIGMREVVFEQYGVLAQWMRAQVDFDLGPLQAME